MPHHIAKGGQLSRVLLAIAALMLLAGGVLHAFAFGGAQAVLAANPMPRFYSSSFKALWLIDSATLASVSALLFLIALRAGSVPGWVLYFLALIPLATAALIYTFVGSFFPAHMFAAAGLLIVIAGIKWQPVAPEPRNVA